MALNLRLFGHFEVTHGTLRLTPLLRPRARQLLAFLLLHRDTPLSRQEIAFKLWPDTPEKHASGTLRRALNELRAALPDLGTEAWIVGSYDTLQWNRDAPYWLDHEAYARLIEQGTPAALHEAISLYRGDLLPDFDDEWLPLERERLRQVQLNTLRQLAGHYRALGEYEMALELTRQALRFDPLAEAVYRDLIALHYEAGDRAAALAEYDRLCALLRDELGVEPMAETEALRAAIVREAPLPTLEGMTGHLAPAHLAAPSPDKLFGREAEREALSTLWESAAAGQGRFAIVSGEAGVGKSHLVLSLADDATRQGGLVLVGHSYEFEQALPFQAIVEMLRAATDLLRYALLAPAHRAALAHLVPDVLGAAGSPPGEFTGPSSQLRSQLFEALLHAFLALARRQPLLLIFEDVHWASPSTLDWLTYIAPRLGLSRVLVVITYRTHEVGAQHALARLERHLAREGIVSRFPVPPLSYPANRELVAHLSGLDERRIVRLADRLFAKTGGNPFFLHELIRGLIETGQITMSDGQWASPSVEMASSVEIPLPDSLRETINARVERLTEMSRMFIRTAAVAGRVFRYDTVRQAGGWAEERALEALEDLLARRFLQESEVEGSFAFSHDLIQEAIYAAMAQPRRIYLHRQFAEVIRAARPQDVEALVHHFIAAGEREKALAYAIQAAQRAEAMYAYEEAVKYRLATLEELTHQSNPEAHLAQLEKLADDYRLLREGGQAVATYQAALDLWQGLKGADQIIALRLYRKILQTTAGMRGQIGFGQFESASQVSADLRARLDVVLPLTEAEPPHPETVFLLKALASHSLAARFPPDWDEALRYAQAAVAAAERLDAPVVLCSALATLASVYGANGMVRERVQTAMRQLALSREPRFDDPRERLRAINGLGSALVHAGEYIEAIPYLLEGGTLAQEIRAIDLQFQALSLLQQCWFRLDRWDEMSKNDEKWRQLQQRYSLGRLNSPCFAIALSAAVHAWRGEFDLAYGLREESYAIMTGVAGPPERWSRSQYY